MPRSLSAILGGLTSEPETLTLDEDYYPSADARRCRYHPVLREWYCDWNDNRDTLISEVIRINLLRRERYMADLPAMMPDEIIRKIQVEESEAVETLSIDELSTRIELYQRATRELKVKEYVTRRKLHDRLSSMSDDEVAKHITRIPAAETETRVRRERKESETPSFKERGVRKPKKGRRSFDDKLAALALTNKDFADFLSSLSPAKKEE